MLKSLLSSGKCFKLICGAGNEDVVQVERLVKLYSISGCKFFDVAAKPEIVDAAKRGIEDREGYICVSVGFKDDPHIRKAQINSDKCKACHKCEEVCPQHVINYCKIKDNKRCIGCGKCYSVCKNDAISFEYENVDLKNILLPLISKGIDCIEFHIANNQEDDIFEQWNYINSVYDGMLSICMSRNNFSDTTMIECISKMIKNRPEYTTIIQADGHPMSGGSDDYKTTLQAVATAEIIQNSKLPVYLILSGGTNSKTAELAKMCAIDYSAIAIGSYARKIVEKYIKNDNLFDNKELLDEALKIAQNLLINV